MHTKHRRKKTGMVSAAAAALLISSAGTYPALSDDCTDRIEKVESALATANLSEGDLEIVKSGHASALNKQAAGDGAGCVADLQQAAVILNLE